METVEGGNNAQPSLETNSIQTAQRGPSPTRVDSKNDMVIRNESQVQHTMTFPDYQSIVDGIENCLEFGKDETSDMSVLVRLFEQAINLKSSLNPSALNHEMLCDYLQALLEALRQDKDKLE